LDSAARMEFQAAGVSFKSIKIWQES
jgi:hypothetical protein